MLRTLLRGALPGAFAASIGMLGTAVAALPGLTAAPVPITINSLSSRSPSTLVAEATPRGVVLRVGQAAPPAGAAGAISPPRPAQQPFIWSAIKSEDGTIRLAGVSPDTGTQSFLLLRAGEGAVDSTALGGGAPPTFIRAASAGLRALATLTTGTLSYDGAKWSLAGEAASPEILEAARAALSTADPGPDQWTISIAAAAALPKAQPPVAPAADSDAPSDDTEKTAATEPPRTPDVSTPAPAPSPIITPQPAPEPKVEVAIAPVVPVTPPAPASLSFTASKRADGVITLTGDVPTEPARRYLNMVAGTKAVDEMQVADADPGAFMAEVNAGLRALLALNEGKLTLADGKWALSGKAADTTSEDKARQLVAALPDASSWSLGIEGPPPFAVCSAALAAFDERNPLLFRSGSAVLADQSIPALDELAGYLAKCPNASVHVEGHTDADGPDDLNLALSVARAEAVVDALAARGIADDRLYAIGYGESLPIAANDSNSGKQRNRRIVVTVIDDTK